MLLMLPMITAVWYVGRATTVNAKGMMKNIVPNVYRELGDPSADEG